MNRNKKEKYARIEIRVKPKDKEKIKQIATKCGLTVSKYVLQRALGYSVKSVVPNAFYVFNEKLSELLNRELSSEVEAAALKLFDDIYTEIIDTPKQTARQIQREVKQWHQQASGPSSPDYRGIHAPLRQPYSVAKGAFVISGELI